MADQQFPVLAATVRTEFGKGSARRLRRDGLVPVVVYGEVEENLHIAVNRLELTSVIRKHGVNAIIEIDVDGDQTLTMVKAIDQNVITLLIDHADLLAIKRGERVEVEVPVLLEGEPISGTIAIQSADVIRLEADVLNIPEEITVSVEGLEDGSQIVAGDIAIPESCTLVEDPETIIASVSTPEEEEEEEPGESDTEAADDTAAEATEE